MSARKIANAELSVQIASSLLGVRSTSKYSRQMTIEAGVFSSSPLFDFVLMNIHRVASDGAY